jgi:outer membrane protein assembly factor BamB
MTQAEPAESVATLAAVGRWTSSAAGALLLAFAGLAAACGGAQAGRPGSVRPDSPVHKVKPEVDVAVILRDGDTGRPLRKAHVRIGSKRALTNVHGVASLQLNRHGMFAVRAAARGYTDRTLSLPFMKRRYRVVQLYRPQTQWTMYGATPQRTQAHDAIELRPPFRVVWERHIGYIEFPAVVSDGVAYISNLGGTIRALRMLDGKRLWYRKIRGGKSASSPAVVGEDLVVHGMDGYVRVLDKRTGQLRWRYHIGAAVESSPVVAHGIDYFGAWNGNVYALDLHHRRLRWIFRSGYKITSSAALSGGKLFIGDYGGRVWALSPATGRQRWVSSVGGRIYGTPAVANGRVFVPSSTGNSLTAFSVGGRHLWTINTGAYVYSSPAVWAGRVYFGSFNGALYCINAASGRILWTYSGGRPISGAPTVVARVVYFSNTGHRTYGLNALTGRQLMTFDDGDYVPISGNSGKLLVHGFATLYGVAPK